MSRLLDAQGTVISQRILHLLPRLDVIRVENRTLDGQFHVQTIGAAARLLDLQVVVTDSGRYTIDSAYAIGAILRAEADGWYRSGVVQEAPEWQTLRPGPMVTRLYLATFTLAINAEGAV